MHILAFCTTIVINCLKYHTKVNPSVTENSISKITDDIGLLNVSISDLFNYVTKMDSIKTLLDRYISQQTRDSSSTNNNNIIHERLISYLESLCACSQLNKKIESSTISIMSLLLVRLNIPSKTCIKTSIIVPKRV